MQSSLVLLQRDLGEYLQCNLLEMRKMTSSREFGLGYNKYRG